MISKIGECIVVRRDTLEKITVKLDELDLKLQGILDDIHNSMFEACRKKHKSLKL